MSLINKLAFTLACRLLFLKKKYLRVANTLPASDNQFAQPKKNSERNTIK
jgi:hypothetical protein